MKLDDLLRVVTPPTGGPVNGRWTFLVEHRASGRRVEADVDLPDAETCAECLRDGRDAWRRFTKSQAVSWFARYDALHTAAEYFGLACDVRHQWDARRELCEECCAPGPCHPAAIAEQRAATRLAITTYRDEKDKSSDRALRSGVAVFPLSQANGFSVLIGGGDNHVRLNGRRLTPDRDEAEADPVWAYGRFRWHFSHNR